MTLYRVRHETIYEYSEEVVSSHGELHLLPRRLDRQSLERLELRLDPTPDTVKWHKDYFGNDIVFFGLQVPHQRLAIRTQSEVRLAPTAPPDTARSPAWEEVSRQLRKRREPDVLEAYEYVFGSPFVQPSAELAEYGRPSFAPGRPLAEGVLDLCHRIHGEFRYDREATTLETPLDQVLRERGGVCQDFAHVMIGALRSLGLAARYVSGYLRTRRDAAAGTKAAASAPGPGRVPSPAPAGAGRDGEAPEEPLVGSEASHAWVAVWCPVLGWIEVDPTNDLVPSDRHVVLAWGRDYDDVSPVKGVTLGGGSHAISVAVGVEPV